MGQSAVLVVRGCDETGRLAEQAGHASAVPLILREQNGQRIATTPCRMGSKTIYSTYPYTTDDVALRLLVTNGPTMLFQRFRNAFRNDCGTGGEYARIGKLNRVGKAGQESTL
jgi:hypothetical protein